jgi:ADP-ribosylglycohydrolase
MDALDRFRGSILGLAVGDALGHPTEFVSNLGAIRARWPPYGVTGFEPSGRHPAGTFTDDTQMALAVARALCRVGHRDLDTLMTVAGEEFVAWSRSPENNRAPGGTCLAGCRNLARAVPWREAGVRGSKGCGAAMRAAPVGLYHAQDLDALVRVAAAQSALTHAHPTGVASGVAAAAPVAFALREGTLEGVFPFIAACLDRLTPAMLLDVGCDPRLVESIGLTEMRDALRRAESVADTEADDVCALLGGAWVGEEAVAAALWCVLRAGGEFSATVLRAANSSGDSDSIACVAGSIAGALRGVEGIPPVWRGQVEKAPVLDGIARALYEAASTGRDVSLDASLDLFGAERFGVRPEDLSADDDTEVDFKRDALRLQLEEARASRLR